MTENYTSSFLDDNAENNQNANDSCVSSLKDDSFISDSYEKGDSGRKFYGSNPDSNDFSSNHQHNTSHSFIKNEHENIMTGIIPNIPERFSYSQITSTIIFQNSGEVTTKVLPDKKFAISSSEVITTFLLNEDSFSQFTNPKEIEKDKRIKTYFLVKDIKKDKFMCNLDELVSKLSLQGEYVNQNIITFLTGLNAFFKEKDYKKIKQKNQLYYILLFGAMIILSISVLFFIIYDIFTLISNSKLHVASYIIHILLSICFVAGVYILYTKRQRIQIRAQFNLINYFHGNFNKHFEYIEAWNKSIFETNHIRVSIPISVDYLLFNMVPYQDIKIKDINMDVIKSQLGIHGMLFEAAIIDDNKDDNVRDDSYGGINGVRDTQASIV